MNRRHRHLKLPHSLILAANPRTVCTVNRNSSLSQVIVPYLAGRVSIVRHRSGLSPSFTVFHRVFSASTPLPSHSSTKCISSCPPSRTSLPLSSRPDKRVPAAEALETCDDELHFTAYLYFPPLQVKITSLLLSAFGSVYPDKAFETVFLHSKGVLCSTLLPAVLWSLSANKMCPRNCSSMCGSLLERERK